jgi:hypothetical protein
MKARRKVLMIVLTAVVAIVPCAVLFGQQAPKPLTNDDVISMAQGQVAESIIVSTIQSLPGKFDVSPDALIALHKAGVTEAEMNAIMAASAGGRSPNGDAPLANADNPSGSATKTKSRLPVISIVQDGSEQRLPLEKTHLSQTRNKPVSMGKLAADTVMLQGMQSTTNSAAWAVASHTGSLASGPLLQAGWSVAGVLGQRKPEVTYVWGITNPASLNIAKVDALQVSVDFSALPGINPDEFEPALVKLTPAQNAIRLVGATRGKEDALSNSATEWELYSGFVEDRVNIQAQKLGSGRYLLSPATPLLPGEYGVVLRPISKSKKFSGGDVARNQGDGFMFNSVWSFQVPIDAQ